MKRVIKTIVFIVGVDVLGFPLYHRHTLIEHHLIHSLFFKAFSKN